MRKSMLLNLVTQGGADKDGRVSECVSGSDHCGRTDAYSILYFPTMFIEFLYSASV